MTDDKAAIFAAQDRMEAAQHAMQSGVAMEMNYSTGPTSPKHLRVGVNTALVEASALAKLLIDRGVFSEVEYFEALATAHEEEKVRYEERLSRIVGTPIKLA